MSGKRNLQELSKHVDLDRIPAIVGGKCQVPVYERLACVCCYKYMCIVLVVVVHMLLFFFNLTLPPIDILAISQSGRDCIEESH